MQVVVAAFWRLSVPFHLTAGRGCGPNRLLARRVKVFSGDGSKRAATGGSSAAHSSNLDAQVKLTCLFTTTTMTTALTATHTVDKH